MEFLPNDVIEQILEKLPGKSILRFKSVSKDWKFVIESRYFHERQMIHRRDYPDVFLVNVNLTRDNNVVSGPDLQVLESSSPVTLSTVSILIENFAFSFVSQTSCDGLVCVYHSWESNIVVNPTTRWSRSFPLSSFQHIFHGLSISRCIEFGYYFPLFGFGKDNFTGTYRPVCLYNSSELGLENATTCEVFDFSTNAWRFVVPASPHRIIRFREPFYFDGSLHWFTEDEETKVLSFDLHTETFQIIVETPFVDHVVKPQDMVMFSLNNRLCASEKKQVEQVIWSFDSGNKTWAKLYSIDLTITSRLGMNGFAFFALALPGEKSKFLLYDRGEYDEYERLVLHDPETNSYDLLLIANFIGLPLSYFQTLISIP